MKKIFVLAFFLLGIMGTPVALSDSSDAANKRETVRARMEIMYGFTEKCEMHFKIVSRDPGYLADSHAEMLVKTHAIFAENEYFFDEARVRQYDSVAAELIPGYAVKKLNASTMWQRKFYYGVTPENPFTEEEVEILDELKSKFIKKYRDEEKTPLYALVYKLGSVFDRRTLYCYYDTEDELIDSKVIQRADERRQSLVDSIIQLFAGKEKNLGDLSVRAKYRYTVDINFRVPKKTGEATDKSTR